MKWEVVASLSIETGSEGLLSNFSELAGTTGE
jgi:hypothetical protein